MDKGLIKIQELNKQLKQLNLEKSQNDSSIREEVEKHSILEEEVFDLGKEIEKLSDKKINFKNARENRKRDKKKLIKTKLLTYLALLAVITLICLAFSGGIVVVLPSILVTTLGAILVFSVTIPFEFREINNRYPYGNISKINEEIEQLIKQLKQAHSNKNKSDNKLENLQKLRKHQEALIQNILQEKSSIETLRVKVIEEYCNNNPELEEKIDKAYDEDVKAKVKVNK